MSWWYNLVTEKSTAAPRQDDILVSSIKVTCAIQFAVHLLWQFVLRGELYDIMLRHSISRTSSILRWISLVQIGKMQDWNFVEMHCDKTSSKIDQDQSLASKSYCTLARRLGLHIICQHQYERISMKDINITSWRCWNMHSHREMEYIFETEAAVMQCYKAQLTIVSSSSNESRWEMSDTSPTYLGIQATFAMIPWSCPALKSLVQTNLPCTCCGNLSWGENCVP